MGLLHCLVVDDDAVGREMLMLNLRDIARCDSAVNGREALAKYSEHLDSDPYELIFLDIIMPEIDGNEVARTIRKSESDRGITSGNGVTIIVLSSLDTPKEIMRSYVSAHSAAHLVKPFKVEKLRTILHKLGLIPEEV